MPFAVTVPGLVATPRTTMVLRGGVVDSLMYYDNEHSVYNGSLPESRHALTLPSTCDCRVVWPELELALYVIRE